MAAQTKEQQLAEFEKKVDKMPEGPTKKALKQDLKNKQSKFVTK